MTILDTNVISELMNPAPAPRVVDWLADYRSAHQLFITSITVAEILYGIEILPDGKRKAKLDIEANAMFGQDFAARVLPFDEQGARALSRIASAQRRRGRTMAEFDAQIAAIAQVHGAGLATRNVADFDGCGIRLVNPWLD